MIRIKYEGKLPSLNKSYKAGKGRFYMADATKDFKKQIELMTMKHRDKLADLEGQLQLTAIEHSVKFFTKKGTISKTKGDIDRFLKPLMDGICKGLGIDDYLITKVTAIQIPVKEGEGVVAVLEERLFY